MASLFHYTNFNALQSILQNHSLRFYDHLTMNDFREFNIGFELLNSLIVDAEEFYRVKSFNGVQPKRVLDKKKLNTPTDMRKWEYEYIKKREKNQKCCLENLKTLPYKIAKNLNMPFNEKDYSGSIWDCSSVLDFKPVGLFSLCHHEEGHYSYNDGLLSQWRGYGKEGGIAIVFNQEKLENILKESKNNYVFDKIVYYKNKEDVLDIFKKRGLDLFEIIKKIYFKLYCKIRKIAPGLTFSEKVVAYEILQNHPEQQKKVENFLKELLLTQEDVDNLLKLIFLTKHIAFEEENEVRIVLQNSHDCDIKYVQSNNGVLRSYFEKKFRHEDFYDSIEKVIIGPSKYSKDRAKKVEAMIADIFREKGFRDGAPPVIHANCPYFVG